MIKTARIVTRPVSGAAVLGYIAGGDHALLANFPLDRCSPSDLADWAAAKKDTAALRQTARTCKINSDAFWATAARVAAETPALTGENPFDVADRVLLGRGYERVTEWEQGDDGVWSAQIEHPPVLGESQG